MSEVIIKLAVRGYIEQLQDTKEVISECIKNFSKNKDVFFSDTAYNLPLYFALTGKKINTVSDIADVVESIESKNNNFDIINLDLSRVLDIGIDTLLLQEFKKVIEVSAGKKVNFIPDNILRSLGVQLVSGDISGIAVIIGPAKDEATAVNIIRSLQEKNILSVLAGNIDGLTMYDQLLKQNVEVSLETYIVNLGSDTESIVLALNWAVRAALTFGGIQGGQKKECLDYCADRVPAFAIALSGINEKKVAAACGAIAMGFPVICNFDVPKIIVKDKQGFDKELLTFELDTEKLINKCVEVRHIKVKITDIPLPVRYSTAFEGERVRKEEMAVEFGGKNSKAFELVISKDYSKLESKKINVIGKEIDEVLENESLYLGIIVRVAGLKMQKDFEPILERQIHRLINCAMGIMHIGQRNFVWIRISKKAKEQGFRFHHFGEIIYAKFLSEYGEIVDKIEIDIITDEKLVEKYIQEAVKIYAERDERIGSMTDESVELFYSCLLCQSFAPNHVCIITPERLGLCGAYNWLDGKAAYQIQPTGPNQPVVKGKVIDSNLGQWQGINEFVYKYSNKSIERFSAYSLLIDPMTSCGCFECIVAILPGTCGFMLVDRTFQNMTPCGMTFSSLAGVVGGGKQSPGFLGIGINYITSKKFLLAESGIKRLVWMPSQLKERLKDKLQERANELAIPDLIDKIADETITSDMEKLIEFLIEKKHPALELGEMI